MQIPLLGQTKAVANWCLPLQQQPRAGAERLAVVSSIRVIHTEIDTHAPPPFLSLSLSLSFSSPSIYPSVVPFPILKEPKVLVALVCGRVVAHRKLLITPIAYLTIPFLKNLAPIG